MRKNFGAKPYTYPQPVFILAAFGEGNTPCVMNAIESLITISTFGHFIRRL